MEKSLLDIAKEFLAEKIKPQNIEDIFTAVQEKSGLDKEEFMAVKAQFYSDFTLCSNFIYCGKDEWDIKERQSQDLFDCDSTFYIDPKERKLLVEAKKKKEKQKIEVIDNDSISGYEGVEEYVEKDNIIEVFDDVDPDDFPVLDHYDEEDDDDDDEDYNDILEQYEDLYDE